MIVTCSACSTQYRVDPQAIGAAGRMVRCSQCGRTWHQAPEGESPRHVGGLGDAPVLEAPALTAAPDLAPTPLTAAAIVPPARKRRVPWAALGWVVLLALVAATGITGVMARDRVISLWPGSAKLYAMVGLPPTSPTYGLALRKLSTKRGSENGVPALIIDGEVVNDSPLARDVPGLKAVLHDRDGKLLQSWDFASPEPHLSPGASVAFHTSIPQPSAAASAVVVTFSEGG
jgi:predicted Zn finger-like uncharacterized protein